MARAATTEDVFNAIGERDRRHVLNALLKGESSVGDLVHQLPFSQPQVSKHLGVLRHVDLVRCRSVGRQRLYSVNAHALKPMHDWLSGFEHLWNQRLDRLESLLTEMQEEGTTP